MSYKQVVPQNLFNIAMNVRVNSCERLIKRGLWHATDPAMPGIFAGRVTLGQYDSSVCIIIENKVRVSMKDNVYKAKAAPQNAHVKLAVPTLRLRMYLFQNLEKGGSFVRMG